FPTEEWEYPMGHISLMGGIDGNVLRARAPRLVPGMTLEVMAKHAVPFWMTSEDLPDPRNRVTVDRDGGIRLTYSSNNDEAHRRLAAKLKSLLKHIECEEHHLIPLQAYVPGRIPLAGVAHQNGTVRFGTDVLTFEPVSDVELAGEQYEHLEGVFGLRMRVVRLRLGDEAIELTEYLAPRGRPIPPDARSNDRSFQHMAIIVSDIDRAYRRLRERRVEHVSAGPQRLADWHANAGGIRAFYFK